PVVPYGERKHAAQFFHATCAKLFIEMDDHLCVRLRLEGVALRSQELPQFLVVINLSIKDNPNCTVFVGEGLVAGVEVDDREPTKAQADRPRHVVSLVVGTAMIDCVCHRLQKSRRDARVAIKIKLSADATHCDLTRGS